LWGVCGKKFHQEVDPKNKPDAFSFFCVYSVSFFHPKSDAPIGCTFHQLAECGVLLDTFFCPLTFCPVMENPDVQQMLESASPIGHHIRCYHWTAYAETKGEAYGA
jgi:hypothetical protein